MGGLLGGGGAKAMLPLPPPKLLLAWPPVPPPPCYYAYAFRLMDFSKSRYGIKGRFRGDVVWNRGRTFERRTSETAYHISSVAAFGSDELKIKAKDSQIVGYKKKKHFLTKNIRLHLEIHTNPRCHRIYAIKSPVFTHIRSLAFDTSQIDFKHAAHRERERENFIHEFTLSFVSILMA